MELLSKIRPQVMAGMVLLAALSITAMALDIEYGEALAGVCAGGIVAAVTKLSDGSD